MRSPRPTPLLAVLVTAVLLVAAACGNDDGGGADAGGATDATTSTTTAAGGADDAVEIPADELVDMTGRDTVEIDSVDNTFEPKYVEITAGTRVVWKNLGRNPHDILPSVDGAFPSVSAADMPPGASHIVTFAEAGDFPYYCSTHGTPTSAMNGAIRVVPAS